jgi:NAD(P)-dependent dehydrogenase (short-subunit alcohol dehydrogenase family)
MNNKDNIMNAQNFSGRKAIITGGARGMGAAAARAMLERGAKVCLWDANADALAQKAQELAAFGPVMHRVVDVSAFSDVAAAAQEANDQMGGLDILVNSAGIAGPNAMVEAFPPDDWARVMQVNLNGVFHCARAVVPFMKEHDYGRIINVASVAGKEGNPNASAYSASKAGVISLTKSLGKELAQTGIRVNAITPAVIKTEMLDDVTEEQISYMLAKIPMGRMGTVDEVAEMVMFLSSEACSYSTAAVFDMSGGRATY